MSRVRLQATLVFWYDCDPKNFGTDDPQAIAAESMRLLINQIETSDAVIEPGEDEYTLSVEVVEP